MTAGLAQSVARYPTSFGVWAAMILRIVQGTKPELAVAGPLYKERMRELDELYIPWQSVAGCGGLIRKACRCLQQKTAGREDADIPL